MNFIRPYYIYAIGLMVSALFEFRPGIIIFVILCFINLIALAVRGWNNQTLSHYNNRKLFVSRGKSAQFMRRLLIIVLTVVTISLISLIILNLD